MEKTVFVIGAGASYEFGMPTGAELVEDISDLCGYFYSRHINVNDTLGKLVSDIITFCRNLPHDHPKRELLPKEPNELEVLAAKIKSTIWLSDSIDNYINEQNDKQLKELCKILIFSVILYREQCGLKRRDLPNESFLNQFGVLQNKTINPLYGVKQVIDLSASNVRSSYLVSLFKFLRSRSADKEEVIERLKNTTIICFNYDRCIQNFLHQAFKKYEGWDDETTSDFLNNLTIIHPYGSLGPLTQNNDNSLDVLNFGDTTNLTNGLSDENSRIVTFNEQVASGLADEMKAVMSEAKRTIFLGFGYHPVNMQLLGCDGRLPSGTRHSRTVYGTAFGIKEFKLQKYRNQLLQLTTGDQFGHFASENNLNISQSNCADFLEEYILDY